MVYLLGLGTVMSLYYMYKNKTQIGIHMIRYYTYLDEYFSNYFKTAHTNIIYLNNDGLLSKTEDINHALMNMSSISENKFIIVKNFIVKNANEPNKVNQPNQLNKPNQETYPETQQNSPNIYKTFYDIYYLNNELSSETLDLKDTINSNNDDGKLGINIKSNIVKTLFDVHLDVRMLQTYTNINDALFCNHINLFEKMMDWDCPLIAASLTINDSTHIYNFTEYDMTPFFVSLLRPNSVLSIDNTMKNKKLWVTIFNYVFKSKNIIIPDSSLENIELFWTIVFDDGNIITGKEIKIEL